MIADVCPSFLGPVAWYLPLIWALQTS